MAAFCKKHGIRGLSLFGSVIRDDFGPDSDVDVLAEFRPEVRSGLFGLVDALATMPITTDPCRG